MGKPKDLTVASVFVVMKPCLKSCPMCEIRVSLGSLAALAVLLCVLSLDAPAHAFRQGFVELPQALADYCPKAHACVPSTDQADCARLISEIAAARTGPRTQGGAQEILPIHAGLALVPGQGGGQLPDRLTTRSFVRVLPMAELAADAASFRAVMIPGGAVALVIPASAAPHSWAGDAPARRPVAGLSTSDLRLAAGSATGSASPDPTKKPMADADQPDATQPGSGEKPADAQPPEFTGSAEQAEPDLSTSEEENLIQGGWK